MVTNRRLEPHGEPPVKENKFDTKHKCDTCGHVSICKVVDVWSPKEVKLSRAICWSCLESFNL